MFGITSTDPLSRQNFLNFSNGPPRGKRDGVIQHILERENENWMEKLRYFVNDQSGIQRDWVNFA